MLINILYYTVGCQLSIMKISNIRKCMNVPFVGKSCVFTLDRLTRRVCVQWGTSQVTRWRYLSSTLSQTFSMYTGTSRLPLIVRSFNVYVNYSQKFRDFAITCIPAIHIYKFTLPYSICSGPICIININLSWTWDSLVQLLKQISPMQAFCVRFLVLAETNSWPLLPGRVDIWMSL